MAHWVDCVAHATAGEAEQVKRELEERCAREARRVQVTLWQEACTAEAPPFLSGAESRGCDGNRGCEAGSADGEKAWERELYNRLWRFVHSSDSTAQANRCEGTSGVG